MTAVYFTSSPSGNAFSAAPLLSAGAMGSVGSMCEQSFADKYNQSSHRGVICPLIKYEPLFSKSEPSIIFFF